MNYVVTKNGTKAEKLYSTRLFGIRPNIRFVYRLLIRRYENEYGQFLEFSVNRRL